MRYEEWVETILRRIIDGGGGPMMFGIPQLAERLGLDVAGVPGPEPATTIFRAIAAAVEELDELGLLSSSGTWSLAATPEARHYRAHPLSELFPRLRAGHLEPDEEEYLRALGARSEVDNRTWFEVRYVKSEELFADLGWTWDRGRSLAIGTALAHGSFAKVHRVADELRIALCGVVRVDDRPTAVLAEAREYLALGRARAAGGAAGVELERRLKALVESREPPTKPTKSPIARYNDALGGAKIYGQPTWRRVQHLGDLRNLCAHVLDHEPTRDEARELVDGVESLLRELPES